MSSVSSTLSFLGSWPENLTLTQPWSREVWICWPVLGLTSPSWRTLCRMINATMETSEVSNWIWEMRHAHIHVNIATILYNI